MTTCIEKSRSFAAERTCAEAEFAEPDVLAKEMGSGAFVSGRDPPQVEVEIEPPFGQTVEMGFGELVSGRDPPEAETEFEEQHVSEEEMGSGAFATERDSAEVEAAIDQPGVVSTEGRSILRRAFDEAEAEIIAISDKETAVVNLEPFDVLVRILGLNGRLRSLRDEAAALPGFDVLCIDRLPTYAMALFYVHLSCRGRACKADVSRLAAKVTAMRERLLADLHSAELRGAPALQCDLSGNRSYAELGEDVLVLVCFFRRKWSELEGKSGLSLAELDEAELLAEEFTFALAARDVPRRESRKRARLRAKAFTLLVNTYEEVRRGVSYLRWREREQFAPSLYANRIHKRRKRKTVTAVPETKIPQTHPELAPEVAQG